MRNFTKVFVSLLLLGGAMNVTAKTEVNVAQSQRIMAGDEVATPTVIEWVASAQGYEATTEITTIALDEKINAVFDKGTNSNTPKYYMSGTAVRAYGGNTITISGGKVAIQKVEFTFGNSDGSNEIAADKGAYAEGVWTPAEGDANTNNVKFTIGGTTGNRRIAAVKVTYVDDENAVIVEPVEVHIANTAETAYTVAQAVALIDAGDALDETVFVKGIVSQVDKFDETSKYITYWISDDGKTDGQQFELYHGKGIDGADFASIEDVKVRATVIVTGKLSKYGDTYEMGAGNALVSYTAPEKSDLMKEAETLAADDEAVAVGKLIEAIAAAEASGDETELATAVAQFKTDNADLEKDETAKVGTSQDKWAGATGFYTGKKITTAAGEEVGLAEGFGANACKAGFTLQQEVAVTNGAYKVELYATSHNAWGGQYGGVATLTEDANDVAQVFVNADENFTQAINSRKDGGMAADEPYLFSFTNVKVSNGKLTLGLAVIKDDMCEWQTVQIKSLTWFTTAKEAYAAVKADMQAALDAAKALKTADRTAGVAEFDEAIAAAEAALNSNMLNIAELEAKVAALNTAAAAFRVANYVTYEGVAFVKDAETGKLIAAGNNWGTRGLVNEVGLDLTFSIVDGKVNIEGGIVRDETNHYLGNNLYLDSPAFGWSLEKNGEGYYITDGSQYISVDADGNLAMSGTPRLWIFIPADEMLAARMASLATATTEVGVDATFLLQNPNFNRYDTRVSAWVVSEDCTKSNLNGGANGTNGNNCAESYHSTFTISQVVNNAPKGIYKMTAQGFFRQDDGAEEAAPLFFIGDATGAVPARTGSEDNMTDAGIAFTTGAYTIDTITYAYNGEGDLVVGIKNEAAVHQWIIFDNFRLTYFAAPIDKTALETAIADAKTAAEALTSARAKAYLDAAIAAAETVVAEAKTQDEIDAAVVALNDKVAIAKEAEAYQFGQYAQYAWESPKGAMCEKGGVITYENGDGDRLNYQQAGYYTICLNGKKANMGADPASANSGYMLVTLDEPVQEGDVIRMSAFLNKNASKTASAWFVFENDATLAGEVYGDEANIYSGEDITFNGAVTTKDVVVPAAAAGSKTIKITRNTAGTNLFVTKLEVLRLPVDITLNVESGKDIVAELLAATEGKDVKSITINLAEGGSYALDTTITTGVDFALVGNGSTITMAESRTDNFLTLDGTTEFALKADGTESDHKLIKTVSVSGVKVLGLKAALVRDNQKTLVETLTVENSVVEMPAAGKNVFDFNGKGYAGKLVVNNSTIYAAAANSGFFAQYGSRPKNVNSEWLQVFDIQNSTIVNIANGKNMCDLKQNGTAQNVYVVKNNIFVDCGKQNQVIVGLNKGQASATPSWDVDGNIFNWGGADVSAAEVEKAGKVAEEDIVKNSIAAVVTFADLAAGDLNATLALAEGAVAPETVGDPRWTITVAGGGEQIADGIYDLTQDMFMTWASLDATEGTPTGCAFDVEKASQMIYGDSNVGWLNYANLSGYDKLVVIVTSGAPRFCFNRTADGAQDNDDPATSQFIDIPGHNWGTEAYQTVDEDNKRFIIDLKKMTQERGFAHLHAIKGANWSDVVVVAMKLVKGNVDLPSGIENIAAVAAQKDGKFFINGQLVIVRNGQQFNAKGQLVK